MRSPFSPRILMLPLVPAYRVALTLRELWLRAGVEPVRRLHWPVVSIGNLSTGGAGKTPLAITLAKALTQRGWRVDVLTRGYGRESQLPARVDPDGTSEEFGDEPLLIARETGVPVYLAPQRFDAGRVAEAEAPPAGQLDHRPIVHLLDDGFQHRQLFRDVDILLLDRQDWQDRLLPAGNLREPLHAMHRAGVIAIPANDPDLGKNLRACGWNGPVWGLRRKIEVPAVNGIVVAFCGIARPGQFFAGLKAAGLRLATRRAFPDHHRYTLAEVERLLALARAAKATALITTEKDQVRLGRLCSAFPESLPLLVARLRVEIEDEHANIDWLKDRLAQGST